LARGKKGKISAREWPAIIARHRDGESLVSIARAYHCTPPAISYILKRSGEQATARKDELAPLAAQQGGCGRRTPLDRELRERVNSDIASFIVAFEAAYEQFNSATRVRLIEATDRLLRTGAHTRLAVERAPSARGLGQLAAARMQKQ
jgi:hypothetical protein